ncbi:MAG: response regulator, partial [Lachnospiraceae bacterium]|nr:response regulator [Lachnospiraceae bacterium]
MAGRILIVDDEEVYRTLCMRVLGKKYTVMSASNGTEALDLFRKFRPGLILVDILMPGMSGFEFVETLDREGLITDIPVVYMTSDDAATSEPESFRHGANDYIHKPFVPDVLVQRIGNIMRYEETKRVLRKDADVDEQTQLLNRRATIAAVDKRMADPLGTFMMLDIDYFKQINDGYGHEMGDRILVGFADVLRAVSRRDDVIGRIGGDEFIMYLDGK